MYKRQYQMSNIGKQLSLATICHENGHLLFGYPDLYDYTGKTAGCGTYSLMSYISNEKNPVPTDPYCSCLLYTSSMKLISSYLSP